MRVLIADDHADVCTALRLLFDQVPGCQVLGEARDALSLLAQAARLCPDVVVLDPELAGLPFSRKKPAPQSLAELVATLRVLCPKTRIVGLGNHPEDSRPARTAGVDGFACKSDPPETLLGLITDIQKIDQNYT